MANIEDIGGVGIGVTADFSDLDAQFDAAIAKAQQRSSAMASAIQDGVKAPDVSPVTNALDGIATSAQSVGQKVEQSLKFEAPTIDLSQVTGALSSLSGAASSTSQEVTKSLSEIQAPAIDTTQAIDSLSNLVSAVQSTAQEIPSSFANAQVSLDTTAAIASLSELDQSAKTTATDIKDDLASQPVTIDVNEAISALSSLDQSAQTTADDLKADFADNPVAIDTAPAVASLNDLATAAQASMQEVSADFANAATGEEGFNQALAALVGEGASVNEAFQQLTGSSQSFMDALASGNLEQFMADFGKIQADSEGAVTGLQDVAGAATTAAAQLGLFDDAAQTPFADATGQLNLFATELEIVASDCQSAAGAAHDMGGAFNAIPPAVDPAVNSLKQFSEGAQAVIDKQNAADAALQQAQSVFAELSAAYDKDAASADALARSAQQLQSAFDSAHPAIQKTADSANLAEGAFTGLNSILGLVGVSLSLAGFVKFAESIGEATDSITHANIALTALTGDANVAAEALEKLADLGVQDGLSIPSLQTALMRMESIIPAGHDLVGILSELANSAAVTGNSVVSLADKLDRIVESGKISPAVLKAFGLSMDDLRDAMDKAGVSADKVGTNIKKAFDNLSANDQLVVLQTGLLKFQGIAEDVATHTLGGIWDSAVAQWHKNIEIIQKDLGDVVTESLGEGLNTAVKFAAALFVSFGTAIVVTVDSAKGKIQELETEFQALGTASSLALQGNFAGAAAILQAGLSQVEQQVKATEDKINADLDAGAKIVQDIMNQTGKSVEAVIPPLDHLGRAGKESIDKVSASFKDYDNALRDFHDIAGSVSSDEQHQSDLMTALSGKVTEAANSIEHAKQNLGFWVDELNQANPGTDRYNIALQETTKWVTLVEKEQSAYNKALDDYNSKAGVSNNTTEATKQAFLDAQVAIELAHTELIGMGVIFDDLPPKMDPVNAALIAFGNNAQAAGKPAVDFKTTVGDLIEKLPGLDTALAQNRISLDQFDTDIGNLFSNVQKLAKSDLPAAIKDISVAIQDLINNQHWDQANAGVQVYQGLIDKMAKEDLPAAVKAEGDLIAKLQELQSQGKATFGDIYDAQYKMYQMEITYSERTGQDATKAIYNLEAVKLKQDILKDSADGLGKTYVAMFEDINKGFDQMAGAMADAIVNGKNLGDALVGVFKKIATSILDDLIKGALRPLEDELKKAESDLFKSLAGGSSGGFSETAGALGAGSLPTAGQPGDYGGEFTGSGEGASGSGGGGGGLGGLLGGGSGGVDTVTGIIAAGAAVATTVLLGHISSDTGHIEVNTRECEAELRNVRADLWSQFGQMYGRLGEVKNPLDAINDTLKQMLASGAGGGFPEQAMRDLDDIAKGSQVAYVTLPAILGALGTIASDLVTGFQEIEGNYLSVIVQKLGQMITNGLTAAGSMEGLASADGMAAMDSDITAAVGDAADQASTATAGAMESASSDITAAVGDSATYITAGIGAVASSTDALAAVIKESDAATRNAVTASATTVSTATATSGDKVADAQAAVLRAMEALKEATNKGDAVLIQAANAQLDVAKSQLSEAEANTGAIKQAATTEPAWIKQQIDISAKAAQAATDTASQVAALRNEYVGYQALMEQAMAAGDLKTAEAYRQQAANIQAQILPLLSDTAIYTRDAAAADGQLASTLPQAITGVGFAASGAGQLVALHVDAAATAIASAVAKSNPASFTPSGGTTTNYGPGGSTQNAPTYTNPGIPVGTQPGFGPTGPPPNPYAGGAAPTAPAGLPPGTFSLPIKTEGTIIPDTTSQQGSTIPGYQIPKFAKGGTVDVSGIGIVEKGEYVLDPQQWSTLFGAVEATSSGQQSTVPSSAGPDYAAILKQAEQSDALLVKLEEGVTGVMAQIAIQHDQGAPPAMMEILRQQLLTAQATLNNYEVAMGYAKKTADAVTTGVPIAQNPNQGLPATIPAPIPPDLLNLKGGPTVPNAPAAPSASTAPQIPAWIQSTIDTLQSDLTKEKGAVTSTQALIDGMMAPYKNGGVVPAAIQSAIGDLKKTLTDEQSAVKNTQALIDAALAPYKTKPTTGTTSTPATTSAPTATTFASFATQCLGYLLNIDQELHGMNIAIPTFLAATNPAASPTAPTLGIPSKPIQQAPAAQTLDAQISVLMGQVADAQKRVADAVAAHSPNIVVDALQTMLGDLEKKLHDDKVLQLQAQVDQQAKLVADAKAKGSPSIVIEALQTMLDSMTQQLKDLKNTPAVAPVDPGSVVGGILQSLGAPGWITGTGPLPGAPATGTGVAIPQNPNQGLPTSLPGASDTSAAALQQQILQQQGRIADAIESHSPAIVIDALKVMLASMQQQLAAIQSAAPTVAPSAPGAIPGTQVDTQTAGFYAGTLAELEDIRTTIHSERDILSSMRDSWVAFQTTAHADSMLVGQAIIDAIGGRDVKPLKSFDLGGSVGMDMVAQLHAGEEVLAPDLSQTLRRMLSTPSMGMSFPNPASGSQSVGGRIITINAPITINGAKGGRANAEEFVAHIRRIVPDSNGFSS